MKTILRFATVVACLTTLTLSAVDAQAQTGGKIAVIDISKIFKEHVRFRAKLEDMKKDVEAAETSLRKDRDEIKSLVEQIKKQYTPGSPNYKKQEELIATKNAQLQLRMNLQKKTFMEQEAQIYYDVYKGIEQEVQYFAQRHGIDLVLRYNDVEMKPEDRQGVLAGVNKAVVYQNKIDITYDILQRLNGNGEARRPQPLIPR